jgi:hypothetical protein
MAQDQKTKALSTNIGWIVTRDPPQERAVRIVAIENELHDYRTSGEDDSQYWIKRLTKELEYLKNPADRIVAIEKELNDLRISGEDEYEFELNWIKRLNTELECLRK